MRRITVLLYVAAVLFLSSGCQKNYTQSVYEISMTESVKFNESVGNDWNFTYTCDGKTITGKEQWTVPLETTKTLTIDVTVTEMDTWPDVGFGSLSVDLKEEFETTATVMVRENKGRFKGNRAQWEIICRVDLVEKK